ERNERVVGGAPTEDLGTRVTDEGVAHGLFRRFIIVIQVAAQEGQPSAEIKNPLIIQVGRAALNDQDLKVRKVLGKARGQNTPGRAASDYDVVVGRSSRAWEGGGGHRG